MGEKILFRIIAVLLLTLDLLVAQPEVFQVIDVATVPVLDVARHRLLRSSPGRLAELDPGEVVDPFHLAQRVLDEIVVGDVDELLLPALFPHGDRAFHQPPHLAHPVTRDLLRIDVVAEDASAGGDHAAERAHGLERVAVGLDDARLGEDLEYRVEIFHVMGRLQHPVGCGLLPEEHLHHLAEILVGPGVVLTLEPGRIAGDVQRRFGGLAHEREVEQQHVLFGRIVLHGMNGEELGRQVGQALLGTSLPWEHPRGIGLSLLLLGKRRRVQCPPTRSWRASPGRRPEQTVQHGGAGSLQARRSRSPCRGQCSRISGWSLAELLRAQSVDQHAHQAALLDQLARPVVSRASWFSESSSMPAWARGTTRRRSRRRPVLRRALAISCVGVEVARDAGTCLHRPSQAVGSRDGKTSEGLFETVVRVAQTESWSSLAHVFFLFSFSCIFPGRSSRALGAGLQCRLPPTRSPCAWALA